MRIVLIDNYDSFTWNLVHLLGGAGCDTTVVRNDAITAQAVIAMEPEAIVISPGPCTPNQAGICCDLIEKASASIPIFGVCLGLQSIGQVFGGTVVRAPVPRHGKVSKVLHDGSGLFHGINTDFQATRYHSLVVDADSCPDSFKVSAKTEDGLIMAMSHRERPVYGVQFHPESILSEHGTTIAKNFVDIAKRWNAEYRHH